MPQLHACLSSMSSRLVPALTLIAVCSTPLEADTTVAAVTTTSSTATDSNRSAVPPSTATAEDTSVEGDAEEEDVPEGESGSTSIGVFDGIHAALVTLGVLSSASTASLERNTNATGDIQDLAGALAARTQAMRPGQGGSSQTCRAATLTSGTPLLKRPRKLTQTAEATRVKSNPFISVTPAGVSYTATDGTITPSDHRMTMTLLEGGEVEWTARGSEPWLAVSGSGCTITATPNIAGLSAGTYAASLIIKAPKASNSPQTIPVSLTVNVSTVSPALGLSATDLSFTATAGGSNPATQSIAVSNTGGGTLNWSVSDNQAWLTASKSGSTIIASVDVSGLTAGIYNAAMTVTDPAATNAPRHIPVTLAVNAPSGAPIIHLSTADGTHPPTLTFTAQEGGADPATRWLCIANTGTTTLSWTATQNADWLSLNLTSFDTVPGDQNCSIAIVDIQHLTAGTYSGSITVSDPAATNNPQTVSVSLILDPPPPSATLTWDANTESDLAGYRVYRSTTPGVYGAPMATLSASTVRYQDASLSQTTTYYWVVTAFDSSGNESGSSNEASKSIF